MSRYLAAAVVALTLLMSATALPNSYNRPIIDGHVTSSETGADWWPDELAYRDPNNDNRYYPSDSDLVDLYVTWDADSLYVGLTTVNGPSSFGNGYIVYIDTDAQNGVTGGTDFTAADFYARQITLSNMGADVMMGFWNFQAGTEGIVHCEDPANTTPIVDREFAYNPGFKHMEFGIGWDGIYGLGAGVVPAGTKLRFICAVVGGDGTGPYDALPTSSTGIESNSSTPYDAVVNLDEYVELPVDANSDGVPDVGYPPTGKISGTVTLTDPETIATVTVYQDGVPIYSDDTPAGGGEYSVGRLADGSYDVTAAASSYLPQTVEGVEVADGGETTGVDFALERVTGRIDGSVEITGGGPDVDVTIGAYDAVTGELGGEGEVVVEGGTGSFSIGTVADGDWLVVAEGKGYVEADEMATITSGDTTDVGLLTLPMVLATRFGFTDEAGGNILGTGTTVSLPADSIYYYAEAWIQPRDDDGRVAYWDFDAQDGILLSATSLDPAYPTAGNIILADESETPLPSDTISASMFEDGRAPFLVSGDVIEVVNVHAEKVNVEGSLDVGFDPPAPVRLSLSSDVSSIAVGGDEVARIIGQLVDAAGNDSHVSGIQVNMTATGVGGSFSVSSLETESDGRFATDFYGTVAGTTYVSATVDPASAYPNLDVDVVPILLTPGEPSTVEMKAAPTGLRAGDTATLTAQVVDAWGNPLPEQGISIALTAEPASLVESLESPIVTGEDGVATGELVAGDSYGTIEITGDAGSISVETVYLPVDATIAAISETAPESDPAHNSLPGADLTVLRISNSTDELKMGLDFASNWDGIHLCFLIETKGDAAGGDSDPFLFPVNYAHEFLPDFALTYKYQANDYGDLRRNLGTGVGWEHYDFVNEEWRIGYVDGVNIVAQGFTTKGDTSTEVRVPLSVIGVAPGDTVRVEVYVMQETEGVKRTALDSVPDDATHDMIPDTGNWWDTATDPVTLSVYTTYVVRAQGNAPILTNGEADPSVARPGDLVTYSVNVADAGGGIGDVFIDLSDVGGNSFLRMSDDGADLDRFARDGIYTASEVLTSAASDGEHSVTVTARDAQNVETSTTEITVTADNPATAIRSFTDPAFDDHGADQTDQHGNPTGIYYEYPTNLVFLPGSFDITDVEIFADGNKIVFRTYIRDLAYHLDPNAADWGAPQPSQATCPNPNRTDLNLQKIDIYIDAKEGVGSTSGFPNRLIDIATVDAWDYGIAIEGWGKWFVVSNGSNSSASWDLYKNDSDVSICDDHVENWIDISVNRTLLGLPDDTSDNDAIKYWDIMVTMASHDGDSNDQNLGGIRWVNANTSEWQIGGGRDSEGGRDRDPNIMDVAVSPGQGHEPGRTQQEMLDFTTPEADARFADNKIACVMEASFAIDTSPPVIGEFASDPELEFIPWEALDGAPAVLWTTISDITGVDVARFIWNPVGLPAQVDSIEMVNLAADVWAADIPREDIVGSTHVTDLTKIGEGRVIEGRIRATDAAPSENTIATPPFTFGIPEPWSTSQTIARPDTLPAGVTEALLVFQDGTILRVEAADLYQGVGDTVEVTMTPVPPGLVDVSNIRDDMEFVGVARTMDAGYADGSPLNLAEYPELTLHYPQYDVGGLNEADFGLFGWVPETERWILKGGAGNPRGNTVTGEISDTGTFGIFYWGKLDVGDSKGLSGVLAEPNPFSPNGDGLYDETIVSFYLGRDADYVNIEFYDLSGQLARRLVFQDPTDYTGRTPNTVTWDGTDTNGNVVPYGIYVMRVEAKFKTEPTFERVNRPVVIIK
jgi:hypothetical protein